MIAPGTGQPGNNPPSIYNLSTTCSVTPTTGTGKVSFRVSKGIDGSYCVVSIYVTSDANKTSVWDGAVPENEGSRLFTVSDLANESYTVNAYNGDTSTEATFTISCTPVSGGGGGSGCTLTAALLSVTAQTSVGGWGEVKYHVGGTVDSSQLGEITRISDGVQVNVTSPAGDGDYTAPVPGQGAGALADGIGVPLRLTVYESSDKTGCFAYFDFTIPAYVPPAPVDPSLNDAPRWEPVGGVLPNPVLLKVTAALTTQGVPRTGLHVDVELWRPAATAAFASFRATLRTATQYVDAAPYLRTALVAAQRYPATRSTPFIDPDACLRFYYRFRVVDSTGAEDWQTRAGVRYAVLAALLGATDTMKPYVADGTGRVASSFPSGEGVQFVGLPLEVAVLLPPDAGTPRFAEFRYLDGYGQELEIRSFPLASSLPAGLLRLPLPGNPLPCAATVEVSVRDDDRHYEGACGDGSTAPPVQPGVILTNTGRLLR